MKYKYSVGDYVYDKTKRKVCTIIRIENYKHTDEKWYVVEYRDGFVRNVHECELRSK